MAECNSIIELAIALRDKEIREAKEAQILKLIGSYIHMDESFRFSHPLR